MIDWYERRDELREGQIFRIYDDTLVKLDRRVPCDGTQWYVATWYPGYDLGNGNSAKPGWCYEDSRIEPGDLQGEPLREEIFNQYTDSQIPATVTPSVNENRGQSGVSHKNRSENEI